MTSLFLLALTYVALCMVFARFRPGLGFGGGGQSQTVTQEPIIPGFAEPFLRQSAGTSSRALSTLERLLTGAGGSGGTGGGTAAGLSLPPGAFVQDGRVMLRGVGAVPAWMGLGPQGLDEVSWRSRGASGPLAGQGGGAGGLVDLGPVEQFQAGGGGGGGAGGAADPSQLVAPFSADQLLGFDLARSAALGGNEAVNTALQGLLATGRGDFLAGGPGFDAALEAATNRAVPGVLSRFGSGSGLGDVALGQVTADAFANLYNQERARQQGAQAALPGLGLLPSEILANIGGQQQGQAQRELSAPIDAARLLLSAAQGGPAAFSPLFGQTQTSSVETQSDPLSTILGLGLTGLSLASGFGAFAPAAAAAGAGLSFGAAGVPAGLGSVGAPSFAPLFIG